MSAESVSRPAATAEVLKFARFGILSTLGFGIVLLIAMFLLAGRTGSMNEDILKAMLYVLGAEVVVAIAAVTCVAIWTKPE